MSSKADQDRPMPVLFVGHGSPMNVIESNQWSQGFAELRSLVPRPKAILAVSAHWYVDGTLLTSNAKPKTIHDFYGFPRPLYEIDYPAPGKVDLAKRVRSLLGEERASLTTDWGLDHGTWSVLRWMFPEADVPVIQLSIDRRLHPQQHLALGRSLRDLRHEGVLIFCSGNVTHNLGDALRRQDGSSPPPWAIRFDETIAKVVAQHDDKKLVSLWPGDDDAKLAHPSPDHLLPLIYAAAAGDVNDAVSFPSEGFALGSISMRNILFARAS